VTLDDKVLHMSLKKARRVFEIAYISQVIERFETMGQAAKFIGMDRTALHRKLNDLGLVIKRMEIEGE
jgi:DNA-binding NtrC family response regulator